MISSVKANGRLHPGYVTLVASIMALNALGISVLLPGLPALSQQFGITGANDQQFAVAGYMFGMGSGTLFFGPISDRFGRRGPLILGLIVYIVASGLACLAPSFEALLLWRLIQGFGASATRVIAQSIVRDSFSGAAMARVLSTVFIVLNVVPIMSPAVGQLVMLFAPWQGIMLLMAVLGFIVTCFVWLHLPESLPVDQRRELSIRSVAEGFRLVFSNRVAMNYALAGLALFGSNLAFTFMAQQIYVDTYGLGPWFGLAFAMNGVLMSLANVVTIGYAERLGMRVIVHSAILIWLAVSAVLVMIASLGPVPLWQWLVLVGILMLMFGLCGSNMTSLAMEPLGRVAGTASSVFGFLQSVGSALVGTYIGQQYDGTVLPLTLGFLGIGIAMLAFALLAEKGRLFAAPQATLTAVTEMAVSGK